MTFSRFIFFTACVLSLPAGALASDFKTLAQEQAASAEANMAPHTIPYSYRVDIEVINAEKPDENFTGAYRVNAAAEPGKRVTLIGASWEDYPKGMREELEKINQERPEAEFAEEFWCELDPDEIDILASDNVTVLRETETEAVLSLGPTGVSRFIGDDDGDRDMPKKMLKRMNSEVTFSKPDLRLVRSHIWLSKPTTVKIVAKIKEMDFDTGCSVAPNGLSYVSHHNTKASGKALGKSFGAVINVKLSDLQPN